MLCTSQHCCPSVTSYKFTRCSLSGFHYILKGLSWHSLQHFANTEIHLPELKTESEGHERHKFHFLGYQHMLSNCECYFGSTQHHKPFSQSKHEVSLSKCYSNLVIVYRRLMSIQDKSVFGFFNHRHPSVCVYLFLVLLFWYGPVPLGLHLFLFSCLLRDRMRELLLRSGAFSSTH